MAIFCNIFEYRKNVISLNASYELMDVIFFIITDRSMKRKPESARVVPDRRRGCAQCEADYEGNEPRTS